MKLDDMFFCECLHQRLHRGIWNWLFCWWSSLKSNWFLCLSVTRLLYTIVCVCPVWKIKEPSCWKMEDLANGCENVSNNRYIIVWLQVDVRKYKWNHLLSILREFQYSGASKVGWESQLRGNFMYWTQQGDCKTDRHRDTLSNIQFLCAHIHTHTTFFWGLFKHEDKHHEKQWQILAL